MIASRTEPGLRLGGSEYFTVEEYRRFDVLPSIQQSLSRPAPLERLDPRLSRHCRILRPQIGCLVRTAISLVRVATEFEPVFRRYSRSSDVDHLDLTASQKAKKNSPPSLGLHASKFCQDLMPDPYFSY